MKSIDIDHKTKLIRHWGKWYQVGRSGLKWVRVKPPVNRPAPLPSVDAIEAASASLREAHPETISKPPIDL